MKKLLAAFLAVHLLISASAAPVEVADTGITFTPPGGFKAVPQKIIDIKWPNKSAPRFVVGNEGATTTIAYDLKHNEIPQDKLAEVQKSFTAVFERVVPGIQWKKNQIIELAGRKWIFMELTSNAIDTDIYNMMLVTSFRNKMLIFNFNSTKEDFPKYEEILRASMKTIRFPE